MNRRIVVCDDDLHIVRAVSMKLSRAGFDVETAPDGLAAWEAVQRARPDFVVTDCQMPRMNGLELCEKLRGDPATQDVPVILLTAKGFELDERELRERYGVTHLVTKPFSPRELLLLVQTTLGMETTAGA